MSGFDGPAILGTLERKFSVAPPVIRIWNGAVMMRHSAFDPARNRPVIAEGPTWIPVREAPTIEGGTGVRWPQVMGVRLRLRLEFLIHSPKHGPAPVLDPVSDGFTELDWAALIEAQYRGYTIEVRPHGAASGELDTNYAVELVDYGNSRPNHLGISAHWIEVEGLNPITGTCPAEL